ncbi:MAG: hypothetical protein AAB336_00580, partial [Acidobacteriota bacterium]
YWIYILSWLFVMVTVIKLKGRDPGTQWVMSDILLKLARMSFFATLAWLIGKKYHLHYSLVCSLCVLLMTLTIFVWELCAMLFFHFSFKLDLFWVTIWVSLFSTFFIGGAIFIISFPFQFLFFKLKQNFKKLE